MKIFFEVAWEQRSKRIPHRLGWSQEETAKRGGRELRVKSFRRDQCSLLDYPVKTQGKLEITVADEGGMKGYWDGARRGRRRLIVLYPFRGVR